MNLQEKALELRDYVDQELAQKSLFECHRQICELGDFPTIPSWIVALEEPEIDELAPLVFENLKALFSPETIESYWKQKIGSQFRTVHDDERFDESKANVWDCPIFSEVGTRAKNAIDTACLLRDFCPDENPINIDGLRSQIFVWYYG